MTERSGGDIALNASPQGPMPRGRGARSNRSGRYETQKREPVDDGWGGLGAGPAPGEELAASRGGGGSGSGTGGGSGAGGGAEGDSPTKRETLAEARAPWGDGYDASDAPARTLRTVTLKDASRTIISTNNSPDISFDRSINPYKGCEHGCIYCYARPSHAYWGYSPGLDFESVIFTKPDAEKILEQEFSRPKYRPAPIMIGANTDPYQPVERDLETTRKLLKVFQRYRHPISIITKSALIQRDLDILGPMGRAKMARAAISLTTLDRKLARAMEPRAAAPHRRLQTIEKLVEAGVPVTVMTAPIIPGLNEHEIEALLEASAKAGASGAGYVLLRLPLEINDLFAEWLAAERPDAASKVMSLISEMRGGKAYDATWGRRGRGQGPHAELIAKRFRAAARRFGLNGARAELDCSQFARPWGSDGQASLFGD
jgi:DNA repair photolyase